MGLRAHFLFSETEPVKEIERIVADTLAGLGYELVNLEQGPRGLVRVFIDHPESAAAASVTIEDCERVSKQLSRVFPVEGVAYERLEISSPGLDRVLKKPADFRRFAGQEASVSLRTPLNGRRRFVGILRGASDDGVELEVEGNRLAFRFADVERARLVPRY